MKSQGKRKVIGKLLKSSSSCQTSNGHKSHSHYTNKGDVKKSSKLIIGIVLILVLTTLFFSYNLNQNKKNLSNFHDKKEKIESLPKIIKSSSGSLTSENSTIIEGMELFEDKSYDFNSTLSDPANNFTEFSSGMLQTQLLGDDRILNDTIPNVNNTESHYPSNSSITLSEGIHYQNGTLNVYDNDYHIFNSTEDGHYNGTYSFYDDPVGTVPLGWVDVCTGACTALVINELDDHRKVLHTYDIDAGKVNVYQTFGLQNYGTIEFWIRITNSVPGFDIQIRDAVNVGPYYTIGGGYFQYYSGGWNNIVGCNNDEWYHISIDFECTTGIYQGLAQWEHQIRINGSQYGPYNFFSNNIPLRLNFVSAGSASSYHTYIDAVGYSWSSNYSINENQIAELSLGDYPGTYSFSSDPFGSDPGGWTVDEGGGTVNVIMELDNHIKVLECNDSSGIDNVLAYQSFSEQSSGTVELWVRATQTNEYIIFPIFDGSDLNSAYWGFQNTGFFGWFDGSWNDITAYSADTWYHISLKFDCGAGGDGTDDYHITIDGTAYGPFDFWGSPTAMNTIQIGRTQDTASGLYSYIDAIGYSWSDNYTVGDNRNYIPIRLNFTSTVQFSNYDTELLGLEIISYPYTDILQEINISIWNFNNLSWYQINSSFQTSFQLSLTYEDILEFSEYFNSTGHLIIKFLGENKTDIFNYYLDYLSIRIYYKCEVSIQKTFTLDGTWKYRWYLSGSDYYSEWVYFQVKNLPINEMTSIFATDVINEMLYDEFFSRISIQGFIEAGNDVPYMVGIGYIDLFILYDHQGDINIKGWPLPKRYLNDGDELSLSSAIVNGNSSFELTGLFTPDSITLGDIFPSGYESSSVWQNSFEIGFYAYPLNNEDDLLTYVYNTSDNQLHTNYKLWFKSPPPTESTRPKSDLYIYCITANTFVDHYRASIVGFQNEFDYVKAPLNPDLYSGSFPQGGNMMFFYYMVFNRIPAVTGYRDSYNSGTHTFTNGTITNFYLDSHLEDDLKFSKELTDIDPFTSDNFQEVKKEIKIRSRGEYIDSTSFRFELNISKYWKGYANRYDKYYFNLSSNIFYTYPNIEYTTWGYFSTATYFNVNTSINVYYQGEQIKTYLFDWNSTEVELIITLPDEYNPQELYFSIFTFDGFGIDHDMVRFYINGTRNDFGFNDIFGTYAFLEVFDFFNNTLFSGIIDCSEIVEYNIFVEIYTLNIMNLFEFDDLEVNITQVGSGIWMSQLIPRETSLPYRFVPNINYSINVYYINDTLCDSRIINLTLNNHIESFGLTERYPEDPYFPRDMYISLYNSLGFGITNQLRIYKNSTRIPGGLTTIETNSTNIVVKDYFDNVLYNETVPYSIELNILINITTVYLYNKGQDSLIVKIKLTGALTWALEKGIDGFGVLSLDLLPGTYIMNSYDKTGEPVDEKSVDVGTESGQVVDFGFYRETVPEEPVLEVDDLWLRIAIIIGIFAAAIGILIYLTYRTAKKLKIQKQRNAESLNKKKRELELDKIDSLFKK